MLKTIFSDSLNNISTTFVTALISCFFLTACSTRPEPIEEYGKQLKDVHVNAIIKANNKLVFATDDGVFIYKNDLYYRAGFQGVKILDVVQVGKNEFICAIDNYEYTKGQKTLFKTTNGGRTWRTHMGNYGGPKHINLVTLLAVHPKDKSILFARGFANVVRSLDGGKTWQSVYLTWDHITGDVALLKIDPRNPNLIWSGGAGADSQPQLAKSVDGGDTWKNIEIMKEEHLYSVKDIAIHLNDSKKVIIGTTRALKKSIDGGLTWNNLPFMNYNAYCFTRSARHPETLYASGINAEGTLFFAVTKDFGQTWQMVNIENSPADIHVHDMVSVIENGQEMLYFGTSKGVYRYTFEE